MPRQKAFPTTTKTHCTADHHQVSATIDPRLSIRVPVKPQILKHQTIWAVETYVATPPPLLSTPRNQADEIHRIREPRPRRSGSATQRLPAAQPSRNSRLYVERAPIPALRGLTTGNQQNEKAMTIQCDTCKATFLSTTRENAYVSSPAPGHT